jgi:hypothetical protein
MPQSHREAKVQWRGCGRSYDRRRRDGEKSVVTALKDDGGAPAESTIAAVLLDAEGVYEGHEGRNSG